MGTNGTINGNIQNEAAGAIYIVLFLIGAAANGFNLWDLRQRRGKITFLYMINLAVSDSVLCCSLPFRAVYYFKTNDWNATSAECYVTAFVSISVFYVNMYSSIIFLLWIGITRYVIIVRPKSGIFILFLKPGLIKPLCFVTWIIPCLTVFPVIIHYFTGQYSKDSKSCFTFIKYELGSHQTAHVLGSIAFFFILVMLLIFYSLLVWHLQKSRRNNVVMKLQSGSLKVRRKILASVLMFVVCFMPYHIQRIVMLSQDPKNCTTQDRLYTAKYGTLLLAAFSCCIHPLLHLCLRSRFCKAGTISMNMNSISENANSNRTTKPTETTNK
ncbi:cysteinyl leukotriene receptor 2-like [Protopterus annectens]|uniref:cysteinyl leukotriene receptor 2-like n=1 Tax=Protopterus annectens TaxID=7888 RepID=UPI001CFA0DB4|nr:cysteinyl leukotriene receptor 2-like [Protopterus annectens]